MEPATILVVDDTETNVRLLEAVLAPRGYTVLEASSGEAALSLLDEHAADVVLLDILMPGMDGYEVCRRLRANPATTHLPVIMITASETKQKIQALEAGADDFVVKPFDKAELLATVNSLLRVKRYHDIIQGQAAALAEWNATLEARVAEQVAELERLSRLRRFLCPQLADLIVSSADEAPLRSHRQKVAVLFCDLRGSTAFSEGTEPEEFMAALADFHEVTGQLVNDFEATVGHFAGDGFMVFFNDPIPCENPAGQAVRLAVAMRDAMAAMKERWNRLGHDIGFGVGIALGFATLGEVGFQARRDYTAIGRVVALASRLCDQAADDQILVSPQVQAAVAELVDSKPLPDVSLKGFHRPVTPYNVLSLR
jgi:CheY-like chemotaxis protein